MIFQFLYTSPILVVAWMVALVLAITIHEFSHAAMAVYLGDPTPKVQGRITLNPLKHMEIWGTILLLLAGFGWGKPVAFNPYNLRNQKIGVILVAMAGPASNVVLAVLFSLFLRFIYPMLGLGYENMLYQFIYMIIMLNTLLFTFNLIPIPPLDGSKILFALLPPSMENIRIALEKWGFIILIGLVVIGQPILNGVFNFMLDLVNTYLIGV